MSQMLYCHHLWQDQLVPSLNGDLMQHAKEWAARSILVKLIGIE
jgi:hypothetical protein